MARYHGIVGFTTTEDNGDGIFTTKITERNYTGDILQNNYRRDGYDKINDDIVSNNRISIICDDYAISHLSFIKFAELYGCMWEVTNVDPSQQPRTVLTLGNPYTGAREEAV